MIFKTVVFLVDKYNQETSEPKGNEENKESDVKINLEETWIVEVMKDDVEGKYKPVVGGFQSEKLTSQFQVKLKTIGEYLFKLQNHPSNPKLCKIKVVENQSLTYLITEEGFLPRVIRIGQNKN